MKKILHFLGVLFLFQILNMLFSFKDECKHVYVAVEADTVTLTRGVISITTYPEQGKDIVCVKCFYQTKQQIKYREPDWPILNNGFPMQH